MTQKLVAIEDIDESKDALLRVEWNLGRRCNFDCSYCGPSTHDKTSPHLEWPVIEKTLLKLKSIGDRENKRLKLALTGGEPYLHPRFLDLLRFSHEIGINRISVTTNGSVSLNLYEQSLPYLNYLIISYHFEYARKEKVLNNILALAKSSSAAKMQSRNWLHVHIMMLPNHVRESLEIAKALKEENIHYVLRRIRPQFDQSGEYLKPYSSGLTGVPRSNQGPTQPYYSNEELKMLGVEI